MLHDFIHHWIKLERDWYDSPAEMYVGDVGTCTRALTDTNVYDLFEDAIISWQESDEPTNLVAYGWAAPVDNEAIQPSKHPERRRVALFIEIGAETHIANIFMDDIYNIIDGDDGTGPLIDAIETLRGELV